MEQSVIYIGAGLMLGLGGYWLSCWPWGPRKQVYGRYSKTTRVKTFSFDKLFYCFSFG
jgi:hypothetical protein